MATYQELFALKSDDDLRNRVSVALVINAQALLIGTPSAAEAAWGASVFSNPIGEGDKALMAVLAANSSATVTQIQNATDAAIQTNVDAVAAALVIAHGG
tara:strand:- start:4235 stop:4534 length:300 start_codon:yes stop_codon:yes gene_type:complete